MSERKKPRSSNRDKHKTPGGSSENKPSPPPPEDPDPRLITYIYRDAKPHEKKFRSQSNGFLRRFFTG